MRVLILNTSEHTGGAAIAANRLMEALNKNGVKAKMLVRDKQSQHILVSSLPVSPLLKLKFVWERFVIWSANRFKKHNLFQVDIANVGTDITHMPEFKEADIIHLHWINQGFLSLANIRRIVQSGKPIIWTLHDMWPFTGICHYSGDCEAYRSYCHHCPMLLNGGSEKDLSERTFRKKANVLSKARNIRFVACSEWLKGLAESSKLLENIPVCTIPNAINTAVFRPTDKAEARKKHNLPTDKKLLLFGSQKITDERKGVKYLVEACQILHRQHPEISTQWGIVMAGSQSEQIQELFPIPVYSVGYLNDEPSMAALYNAVDVYVTPSLQDNLPNTIVEAMCCGTPCVGFHVGGIPEMIDHQENGYVARYCDAQDLAQGISFVLDSAEQYQNLSKNAARKAANTYCESNVAMKYIHLYNQTTKKEKA